MKKWFITVALMFLIPTCIGIYNRSSYTDIVDLNDKNSLADFDIIGTLSKDHFSTMVYTKKDEKIVMDKYHPLEDLDSENVPQEVLFLDGLKSTLDDADYIVRAESTGKNRSLFRTMQQEILIKEVYKGNSDILGTRIDFIIPNVGFSPKFNSFASCYVNLMEAGDEYLVFMESIDYKGLREKNIYKSIEWSYIVPYFNFQDKENIIPIDTSNGIKYGEVRDNEFFVEDKYSLDQISKFKHETISRYVGNN